MRIAIKQNGYFNIKKNKIKYRIAILAPFPPLSGGMTQIARSLSINLKNDGHKIYRINLGKGLQGLFPFPKLYFQYFKIINRCDIVHIISASGNALWLKDLPAIIMSRILLKKVILNFVGGMALAHYAKWPWYKKLPFRWSSIVVVPTNIFKNLLIKNKSCAKVFTVPHVVDVQDFNKIQELSGNILILLAAKSLQEYSGFDFLLDIFSQVKEKNHNAEFWIAGDGPKKKELIDKVKNMRLNGVRFLGNVEHERMPSVMKKATIFVHATRYESFGIALVEAMASSLPVISFNVGGIPEVIIDNMTGHLIPYGDKTHFAEAVSDLINNIDKRKRFGKNGKQHSNNFHWNTIRAYWYKLYSNLESIE